VCFDSFQEPISVTLLMLWIINLLVVREECRNEKCSPLEIDQHLSFIFLQTILTINDDIADSVGPVFFILSFAIICTQLPAPMSEDRIALGENLSSRHLNDWNVACWVHLCNRTLALVFWPLVECITDILVRCASILREFQLQSRNYMPFDLQLKEDGQLVRVHEIESRNSG
jgi:hypothetical protein